MTKPHVGLFVYLSILIYMSGDLYSSVLDVMLFNCVIPLSVIFPRLPIIITTKNTYKSQFKVCIAVFNNLFTMHVCKA